MKQRHINDFPAKKQSDLQNIAAKIAVTTLISGASLSAFNQGAYAEINKNLVDSSYIEKSASIIDPPLMNSTLQDLKNMPSYISSSIESKVNDYQDINKSELKKKGIDAEDLVLFNDNKSSFINISPEDYLHYISANGDNVVIHYTDDRNNLLVFDEDDVEKESHNSSYHSSGWFVYPFFLNGGSYHSSSNGIMKSPSISSGNKNSGAYHPKMNSTVKSSTGFSSSKGMGSSMSRGSSSSGGGFGG